MLRLLGLVISISLADSLNPSTIGPSLYLAAGECPRRDVLQFAAGTFVVFAVGGLILTLGPGRAILALVPRPSPTARYILETVAGVAMLVIAAVVWFRRQKLGHREAARSAPKRRSPLVMGAGIAIVELPTAFPYFATIIAIVGSGLSLWRQLVLLGIYNVCFVLPLLAIVVMVAFAGDRAVTLLSRARRFMHDHWPVLVVVVALVVGIFVTTLGVTGLTGNAGGRVGRVSRRLRHLISH
jgi:cytochrome c biogenesis protein CcdA